MVDMSVREDDGVEVLDRQRQLAVLIRRFVPPPLKHPTVERDCMPVYVQKMTGARDLACGTDERYLQTVILPLPRRAETEW
jgi:hypothetical protein